MPISFCTLCFNPHVSRTFSDNAPASRRRSCRGFRLRRKPPARALPLRSEASQLCGGKAAAGAVPAKPELRAAPARGSAVCVQRRFAFVGRTAALQKARNGQNYYHEHRMKTNRT